MSPTVPASSLFVIQLLEATPCHGCIDGFLQSPQVLLSRDLAKVKKGDIWANDKLSHCGLVKTIKVVEGKDPEISIQHASSGLGKVAISGWAKYFKSGGKFYK